MKHFKQYMEEKKEHKSGWLGVDLDGTLAYYTSWKGENHIGEPVPAMLERVKQEIASGRDVRIFTARAGENDKVHEIIKKWCIKHIGKELPITNVKDKNCREIWDDRAKQVLKNKGTFVQ
jgi:hypothetical protein